MTTNPAFVIDDSSLYPTLPAGGGPTPGKTGVPSNGVSGGRSLQGNQGEVLWMMPRPAGDGDDESEDDPCDAGPEVDPMDEAERDDEDREAALSQDCCAEARLNCTRFNSVLVEQGVGLKRTLARFDLKKQAKSCFSMSTLKSVVPILEWGPKYRATQLQGDLIAASQSV